MNNAYKRGQEFLCGGYSMYTPTGKSYFVKNGRYYKTPKEGDIVYFFNRKLDRVAHVESVVECSVKNRFWTMKTVGGNTSAEATERNGGGVALKTYTFHESEVGGKQFIDGFGRPKFSETTTDLATYLKVLREEVGYLEKNTPSQLDHKTTNAGFNNFTKYGAWYGQNGLYWCQQFISWCAYEACRQYMDKTQTKWVKSDSGKWRYLLRGEFVKGEWIHLGGRWYVFDNAGYAITGWFRTADNEWYYLNPDDCAMLSGQWLYLSNGTYYLTESGIMAVNAFIKNPNGTYSFVAKDGLWDKDELVSEGDERISTYGVVA